MRPAIALFTSLAALATACGKKVDDKNAADKADNTKGEKASAKTTEDKKVDGEVTVPGKFSLADLKQVWDERLVSPLQPFDEALAKLQAKLGKPQIITTLSVGDKNRIYHWARVEGDACAALAVQRGCDEACGDNVGGVFPTGPFEAGAAPYEDCVITSQGKDWRE